METKLIKIVHRLRLAKGSNAKLEILKEYSDNELWKRFLVATYDERISYGVSAPKTFDYDDFEISDLMFETLRDLASRDISGKDAKDAAKYLSRHYGEIPRLVLERTIKAGVSVTSINKCYPGLIEVFTSMKGKDVPIKQFPVLSSIKYDGVKVFAVVNESGVKLLTSSGAPFELASLQKEYEGAPFAVYEGELIHGLGRIIDRPVISGQLNSLLAKTKTDISEYSHVVYDCIHPYEWEAKHGITSFAKRQETLSAIFEMHFQNSAYVKQVVHTPLHFLFEVETFFEHLVSTGYEGSMHRYADDVYVLERVDRLIKKKSIKECKLRCISTNPHSNPNKGNIGSLVCRGTVNDKEAGVHEVLVNVGGLGKFEIMQEAEYFVGHEIEVLYNSLTVTSGTPSLFLPRYKRRCGDI